MPGGEAGPGQTGQRGLCLCAGMGASKEWICSGNKGLSVVIARRVGELSEISEGRN